MTGLSRVCTWPLTGAVLVLAGCTTRQGVVVDGPLYLYATASDCAWSSRMGPEAIVFQAPELRGVKGQLAAGTSLIVDGEDIGKDSLCYSVQGAGFRGYVLASNNVKVVSR